MLHFVKSILNEDQCRSVGEAGYFWDDELAVALAAKPPDVVHETLGVLKEILGQWWYSIAAKKITSKLCCTLCRLWRGVAFNPKLSYLHLFVLPSAVIVYPHTL